MIWGRSLPFLILVALQLFSVWALWARLKIWSLVGPVIVLGLAWMAGAR